MPQAKGVVLSRTRTDLRHHNFASSAFLWAKNTYKPPFAKKIGCPVKLEISQTIFGAVSIEVVTNSFLKSKPLI